MNTPFELVIEKVLKNDENPVCTDYVFRAILFGYDEDTGARFVVDIIQCDNARGLHYFFVNRGVGESDVWDAGISGCAQIVLHARHDNVDFGRAKKLSTKVLKVCESL